jgi:hypothetical protein
MIYIISHASVLMLYFLYHLYNFYYAEIKEEVVNDPINEYINKNKEAFIKTYGNEKNMSENIESLFYNKKDYTTMMKTDKNAIELAWKTRILYENTPKGPVVMFYDSYKQAFTYYTDSTSMPVPILNAIAMKYVTRFFCRDFYHDEQTLKKEKIEEEENEENEENEFISNTYISPLIKIHNEAEETEETKKLKKLLNSAPLVRLKSKNVSGCDKKKKIAKNKNVNKFVSLGKMYNFQILQKKKSSANANSNTGYDEMFNTSKAHIISTKMSYKDYKDYKQIKQD